MFSGKKLSNSITKEVEMFSGKKLSNSITKAFICLAPLLFIIGGPVREARAVVMWNPLQSLFESDEDFAQKRRHCNWIYRKYGSYYEGECMNFSLKKTEAIYNLISDIESGNWNWSGEEGEDEVFLWFTRVAFNNYVDHLIEEVFEKNYFSSKDFDGVSRWIQEYESVYPNTAEEVKEAAASYCYKEKMDCGDLNQPRGRYNTSHSWWYSVSLFTPNEGPWLSKYKSGREEGADIEEKRGTALDGEARLEREKSCAEIYGRYKLSKLLERCREFSLEEIDAIYDALGDIKDGSWGSFSEEENDAFVLFLSAGGGFRSRSFIRKVFAANDFGGDIDSIEGVREWVQRYGSYHPNLTRSIVRVLNEYKGL